MDRLTDQEKEFSDILIEWMHEHFGWDTENKTPFPLWNDDWSLIVKLHALVESGLNKAITRELGKPELASIIAKLDTSNQSTGKVAFAKALGIIVKSSALFLQKLSELRNVCVHDINNFKFNFVEYLEGLEPDKRNEIVKLLNKAAKPTHPAPCPQEALVFRTMGIMAELMIHDVKCKLQETKMQLLLAKAQLLDALNQSTSKE